MAGANELQTYDYWKAKYDANPSMSYYQTMMNKYKPATPTTPTNPNNSYIGGAVNVGVGANNNSYLGPGLNLQSNSTTNGQGTTQGNTGTQDGTQDNVDPNKKPLTQKDIDDALKAGYDKATGEFKTEAEKIKEARIQNTINQLNSRFGQVQSDIAAQRSQIDPTYQAKRLNAQSGSALQAKNFAEFLANRGLSRSGTSQQAELMRNMSLQQSLGQLDAQRKADEDYLTKQETDAKRALNSDINQARSDAELAYMDNFLKYKTDMDLAYRQEQLKRDEMAAGKTLRDLQEQQAKYLLDKGKQDDAIDAFTKQYQGLGSGYNYQGEIDKIANDGDATNDWQINVLKQIMQGNKTNDLNRAVTLSQLTGNIPASQLIANMSPEELKYYQSLGNQEGGFQAAINATNDERKKAILNEFRNQKLINTPDSPYINTMSPDTMVPTLQGQQVQSGLKTDELQRTGLEIANKINNLKLENLPDEIKTSLAIAKTQLQRGELENAYQTLVNSNADEKFKAEIDNIYASSENARANAANARASAVNAPTKFSPNFDAVSKSIDNIFFDASKIDEKKQNENTPWVEGGSAAYRTPGRTEHQSVIDMIEGSGLSAEEKLFLYNRHRVPLPK